MEKENCIFCKIINNKIPAEKVYENENFMALMDIKPVSDGHILIIPKKHIVWMQEADDEIISKIFVLTKKLMLSLKKTTGCDFVQESVVGEEIPHFHIHLIPRYLNDNMPRFPTKVYKDGESKKLAEKISSAL